ncbi:VOC family protein [Mesobacillus thioparans]|uniref:VOC family protein n=1 Tax=Mesobacillus thioparans TaxID=370439 RepID=UPI0039F05DAF
MNFHQKPITFVGQVNIKVQDLQRSIAFYEKVIGFQLMEQTDSSASFTADGKTVILTIEQPANVIPKQGRTTGLYHFAILLPERSDLAKIVLHFMKAGVRFGSSDHLVSEALYLSDPDGNGIEVYRDRQPSEWEWKNGEVKMTVDPLDFEDLISGVEQEPWEALPAGTVMGHIHLHVADLKKAEEFYLNGLGFEVVCRYGHQAIFISDGKYHHHIALNTWNGVGAPTPPENSVGLSSYTLILSDETKLARIVDQLEKMNISVSKEHDYYVTTDPSSNKIVLKV